MAGSGTIQIALSTRIAVGFCLFGVLLISRHHLENLNGDEVDDFSYVDDNDDQWEGADERKLSEEAPRQAARKSSPRRARAANGLGGLASGGTSASTGDWNYTEVVPVEKPQGPGQAFGKIALIIAMSIFFSLIFSLMILDSVLARRRDRQVQDETSS
mmetsp:Transcript_173300/g.555856  ORF Transcript_173300/g.555856 Transcript_173300/m.555856 type:complete len:158 (-) Transcript_173300:255-728(-)